VDRTELIDELSDLLGVRHEARFIVEDATGDGQQRDISPRVAEAARALARRRVAGEPLQYILGHWSFRYLDLLVDQRVLIPRPETEAVVEVALAELALLGSPDPIIVDAGTGSGAIALSMATELAMTHPAGRVWAIDVSPDALCVAALNLERVAAGRPEMLTVSLVRGSWLSALPTELRGTIDLVVSNPPYVAATEWDALSIEVQQEPPGALIADDSTDGTPGLADVVTVLAQSIEWLARPGTVVIELAPHQATAASTIAAAMGFVDVRVAPDLTMRPRALVGRLR
jgi:release factor glutamine methyltransferase